MNRAAEDRSRIKGWCPGARRPMLSGDGLVMRVRPFCGRITSAQAIGLARISNRFGNGLIDLSSRGNLQLRGIQPEHLSAALEALSALGLLDRSEAGERRRNLLTQPFWHMGDLTQRLSEALGAALSASQGPELPAKFGFAVDCGAEPWLAADSADIRLETGQEGLILRADGAEFGRLLPPDDALTACFEMAEWFLATGGRENGRMRRHLARGARLPSGWASSPRRPPTPAPKPALGELGALVGVAFGQMTADALAALGRMGALRMTPWRMLLIEGARAFPAGDHLVHRADDPRLRISVCSGAPFCAQAARPTRELAREIAREAPFMAGHLHISGCSKGCAHSGPCDLVAVASQEGWALGRGAKAGDVPAGGFGHEELKRQIMEGLKS